MAHKYVDVTLNGEYIGTYHISDHPEVGEKRVEVPLGTTGTDVSYFLECDGYAEHTLTAFSASAAQASAFWSTSLAEPPISLCRTTIMWMLPGKTRYAPHYPCSTIGKIYQPINPRSRLHLLQPPSSATS